MFFKICYIVGGLGFIGGITTMGCSGIFSNEIKKNVNKEIVITIKDSNSQEVETIVGVGSKNWLSSSYNEFELSDIKVQSFRNYLLGNGEWVKNKIDPIDKEVKKYIEEKTNDKERLIENWNIYYNHLKVELDNLFDNETSYNKIIIDGAIVLSVFTFLLMITLAININY
ncbi:MAG: hypothetical protein ACRC4M_03220 [Mycoplasma sp.]